MNLSIKQTWSSHEPRHWEPIWASPEPEHQTNLSFTWTQASSKPDIQANICYKYTKDSHNSLTGKNTDIILNFTTVGHMFLTTFKLTKQLIIFLHESKKLWLVLNPISIKNTVNITQIHTVNTVGNSTMVVKWAKNCPRVWTCAFEPRI